MRNQIEAFFQNDVAAFTDVLSELEARIPGDAQPDKDEHYQQLDSALTRLLTACQAVEAVIGEDDEELLTHVQRRFQEQTDPWCRQSWFANHARTKPRGFPGDFEMLSVMYDGEVRGRGLGGYLDLRLLDLTLLHAVRARLTAARQFLIEETTRRSGDVHVLDVACGPCREYEGGLPHRNGARVHVTCIDNDPQALDYVAQRLAPPVPGIVGFEFSRYNALRMTSSKTNIRKFGRADIIYSVGLADYIPDRPIISMLQGWRESLNEDGVLYVAFKDINRYDRTPYAWFLDWHFLPRTEDDCFHLFQQAGFDARRLDMSRDDTGVIMNFCARVGTSASVRIDSPEGEQRTGRRPVTAKQKRRTADRLAKPST
jgi:extracellular factor (EF) 3-hydroxypalmitic acid methyl ester biosynthesis protein